MKTKMKEGPLFTGLAAIALLSMILIPRSSQAFSFGDFWGRFFGKSKPASTAPQARPPHQNQPTLLAPADYKATVLTGEIRSPTLPATCQTKADCAPGMVCNDASQCDHPANYPSCDADAKCPCGQQCNEEHLCENIPSGHSCTSKTDCASGETCWPDHQCAPISRHIYDNRCTNNDECLCGQSCNNNQCADIIDPTTPPKVVGTSPKDGAALIGAEPITVEFSKPMDLESLKKAISLKALLGAEVSINVSPYHGSKTLFEITPRDALQITGYFIRVTKDAKDTYRNSLDASGKDFVDSSFAVGQNSCVTEPELTIEVTKATCVYHKANPCNTAEEAYIGLTFGIGALTDHCKDAGNDKLFNKGDIVVTDSDYKVAWSTKNAQYLTDTCGHLSQADITAFDRDSGEVDFLWDGVCPLIDNGVCEVRRSGSKSCTVTAHGACKTVTANYSYSCP